MPGSFAADLTAVVRRRDFRRLFATRLTSQAGDGAFQVGLATLVFFSAERAATATAAAAAFTLAFLPYTVVGPFAGVLLDRWRRRQVMLVANLVRTVLVLVVTAVVLRGDVGLGLSLLVLTCLSLNRFFLAGLGASLPHVVPAHELVMANAVAPTSGTVAALLGAATGYAVRRSAGHGDAADAAVLVVAAGAYLAAALLTLRMAADLLGPTAVTARRHEGPPAERVPLTGELRSVASGLVAGARHLWSRHRARAALGVIGMHRLAFGLTTVATILVCRYRLSDAADPEAGLAVVASTVLVGGLGFGTAAVVTPIGVRRAGVGSWIIACSAAAAVAQAAVVVALTLPVLLVTAFVIGLSIQSVKICVDAEVQADVDDEYRGRVFSFYDMIYNAAFVASAVLAALVLPPDGYSRPALLLMAVLYALAAVGYARIAPLREVQ
ncbi:MAG TPA: MFS transporter [Kineosporiaceae bacterium]|nr:MFS transporter [Kineosporiaceae bacterium]